jgi:hypothetical protein
MSKTKKTAHDEQVKMAHALKGCLEYLRRDAIEANLAVTAEMLVLAIEGATMDLENLARAKAAGPEHARRAEPARAPIATANRPAAAVARRA